MVLFSNNQYEEVCIYGIRTCFSWILCEPRCTKHWFAKYFIHWQLVTDEEQILPMKSHDNGELFVKFYRIVHLP